MHVHTYLGLPCNFTSVSPDYCPRQSSNISNLDFTFIRILDLVIRQEILYCLQSFINCKIGEIAESVKTQ